jgi:hypothetical protein
MSLTTTSTTPVMPENRGSGNRRMTPFMHAHSKVTESGDVSFYNQSTSEVTQRVLRESNEDSNGERENDVLANAMQTKEQRGHVCGVFSKLTSNEGFLKHNLSTESGK